MSNNTDSDDSDSESENDEELDDEIMRLSKRLKSGIKPSRENDRTREEDEFMLEKLMEKNRYNNSDYIHGPYQLSVNNWHLIYLRIEEELDKDAQRRQNIDVA